MQRQSLGSPVREKPVVTLPLNHALLPADEVKPDKPHRSNSQSEKLIHLIPFLIFFCFLLLYCFSYNPSPQDLAQFRGFKYKHYPDEILEMKDIDEIGRSENSNSNSNSNNNNNNNNNKELKRSNAFVIRSQRNLQEKIVRIDFRKSQSQSHRKLKLADF